MQTPIDPRLEESLARAFAAVDAEGRSGLDAVCAEVPDLANELRRLVAASEELGVIDAAMLGPPERIGRYRLRERLGGGGMGIVYRAVDDRGGAEVAVKLIRPERLADATSRQRFRREAEAIARCEHSAIVPLLEVGEHESTPFLVMPLLDGVNAELLVNAVGTRRPSELAASDVGIASEASYGRAIHKIVREVAEGMAHAHAAGVVHRDIKPANLFVCRDGRGVILDFGLAELRGDLTLTKSGSTLGSPAFMSPEQLRGEALDERTDVYSLAATAWFLLGARLPFDATTVEPLRAQILAGARRPLPPLSADVSPRLVTVLVRAMDVDRACRPASMASFAEQLRALEAGLPVTVPPLPIGTRLRRRIRRRPALFGGLAVATIAVLLLPMLLWWTQRTNLHAIAAANTRAQHDLTIAMDAIDRLLIEAGAVRLLEVPAADRFCDEFLGAASNLYGRLREGRLDDAPLALRHARAMALLATDHQLAGRSEAGLTAIAQAEALLQALPQQFAASAALSRAGLAQSAGEIAFATSDFASARAHFDRARAHLEPALADPSHAVEARILASAIASNHAHLERFGTDTAARRRFVELGVAEARRALALDPSHPKSQRVLIGSLYELGVLEDEVEARPAARLALEEAMRMLHDLVEVPGARPSKSEQRVHVLQELGSLCLWEEARLDEGTRYLREALAELQGMYEAAPTQIRLLRQLAGARHNLARAILLSDPKNPTAAITLVKEAIADQERFLSASPRDPVGLAFLHNHWDLLCSILIEGDRIAELLAAVEGLGGSGAKPSTLAAVARYLAIAAARSDRAGVDSREPSLRVARVLLARATELGWEGEEVARDDPAFVAVGLDR